ncbi:hypothetical protein SAMD00019534_017810 [Acytostelium subglobosum LB1]|uniref:hypothetical protein n=1 Tax=Acytostelium subglobosum LB1 TaxID=1410327 RepID=UPI000644FCA3|nr:hypothetical protein SAMD00019534_017810 [Acytostelium subglobosum LB1]GAM18606.1 hypothetical protein SAMD00019534_017810 [Acytostelium subglobosum LB1]|eukprot:XP_012757826.1 hypothetical protein SAMD00019534_017810 [Acytostelium subglobosum LB1]
MIAIFVIILLAVAVFTTLVLHRYISFRKTPLYVYVMAWIGWYMCFGIVVLVPIDILATKYRSCQENDEDCNHKPLSYVSSNVLAVFYQIFYFGSLLLTWLIYPFLGSLVLAGDFKLTGRIKRSIKENLLLYSIFLGIGIVIVIWLLAVKHLDWSSMVGYVMAAANTWGIILVIILMGYGLVETPRYIWNTANRQITLKHLQFQVCNLMQQKKKAQEELFSTLKLIKKVADRTRKYDPFEEYVQTIVNQCPPEYAAIAHGEGVIDVTYDSLVSLNSRLKNAILDKNRSDSLYNQCVDEAIELEDIMNSVANPDWIIHWSFKEPRTGRFAYQRDRFEWIWYTYLQVPSMIALAGLFVLQSLLLIWSEISVAVRSTDVSVLSNIAKHTNIDNIGIQIILFFPLGYAALVTYSTLFKIRIFNYYRLIPGQHSDSNSILFSAAYLCRLAAPLCYNFITFITFNNIETTFTLVMGEMNSTPFLGKYFYIYFPIVILVVVLATAFNLYTRIMNMLNITMFRFDSDFSHDLIDEGKMILHHERRKKSVAIKTSGHSEVSLSSSWLNKSNGGTSNKYSPSLGSSNGAIITGGPDNIGSSRYDTYNAMGSPSRNSSSPSLGGISSQDRLRTSMYGFPSMSKIFGTDRSNDDRETLLRQNEEP